MKPNATHFQLLKKLIPAPFNNNVSAFIRTEWMVTVITAVVLMVGLEKPVSGAVTYTWAGGASGSWAMSGNWTSSPSTPGTTPGNATTDIVTISTTGSVSITNVPTTTVATLQNTANTGALTLTPAGTNSLTVTTFTISQSGSSVTLGSGLTVILAAGSGFPSAGTINGPGSIELSVAYNNFPGNNAATFGNSGGGYPGLIIKNGVSQTKWQDNGNNPISVGILSIGTSSSSGSNLTLPSNSNFNINVTGTFYNYGTLTASMNGGSIVFAGSGQTFPQGAGSGGVFSSSPPVMIANGTAVTLDASVAVSSLSIGTTSAGTGSSLTLSSNTLTLSGTLNNYGTGTNGLIGPGTLVCSVSGGSGVGIPAANATQGGGFYGSSAANYPSVTVTNGDVVTVYSNVTVYNLAVGTTTLTNNTKLALNSYSITVNGAFTNYAKTQGPTGSGTIQLNANNSIPGTGGGVFSSNPNIIVGAGATVTANAAVSIGTLTINSTGSLSDGGKVVTVQGNITNSGTHTSNTGGSITLNGSSAERTLNGGGSYGNLTLNDGNGAYLNSNATVNGALTLTSGILNPGHNGDTVFVSSTGSVTRTSGWVYGFLAKWFAVSGSSEAQTFQVGDSTGTNYRPVTVTFPSGVTTAGYVIVSNTTNIYSPAPTLTAQDVYAYWNIINHNVASSSGATVLLTYVSGDIQAGTQNTFSSETYVTDNSNANYDTWLFPWTSTDPSSTTTQSTGVTTFGAFIVGPPPPPVQITAGGPLTFCAGGSVTLNSQVYPPTDNYTYTWYQSPSTVVATGTTTYSATASGTYFLSVTDNTAMASYTSNTKTVTVNALPTVNIASAPAAICQGGTTAALGGSFAGDATAAVWSTSGTGTFANNSGSTPGTATYTASATDPSSVTLKLTTSGGSCGTTNTSTSLTVNSAPAAPTVSFNSPAIICEGAPVVLTGTSGSYTYQWLLNGSPILGATSSTYAATSAGAYTETLTNTATGCPSPASAVVEVAELPQIPVDTIYIPANTTVTDTFVSLTSPTLSSYSVNPSGCNINMSATGPHGAATVITTTTGTGGGVVEIVCNGGNVTVGGGGGYFLWKMEVF